jgi:hypothetical protein
MKFEFHPEPRLEFLDTVRYYESCQSGLGEHFIQSMDAAIAGINENPEAWAEMEQDVRRKLTRIFPYAVLYTIEPEYILSWPSCIATRRRGIGVPVWEAANFQLYRIPQLKRHIISFYEKLSGNR